MRGPHLPHSSLQDTGVWQRLRKGHPQGQTPPNPESGKGKSTKTGKSYSNKCKVAQPHTEVIMEEREAITCLPVLFEITSDPLGSSWTNSSTLGTGSLWACLWTHRSCVPHPHYNLKAYIGHLCRHRNNPRHLRALPVFRRRAGLIIFYVGTQYLGFQSEVSLVAATRG